MKQYHSNGKLLLTAEFLVIDGAKALALPCRFGQSLKVKRVEKPKIYWKSFTHEHEIWFKESFEINNGNKLKAGAIEGESKVSERLKQIFKVLLELKPALLADGGFSFESYLEFPRIWGLGSSSTLLANLANWAGVNPFILSNKTFGGSAYDIACAQESSPLIYERTSSTLPKIDLVDFDPKFKDELFFVHLNQKQNTREVVGHYQALHKNIKEQWVAQASQLTKQFLNCKTLTEFEELIGKHEHLLSKVLAMKPVKQLLFPDFSGAVKSLGAWGGDFVLATGGKKEKTYFKEKGYTTVLNYPEMVF